MTRRPFGLRTPRRAAVRSGPEKLQSDEVKAARILLAFGPDDNAAIARAARVDREWLYRTVYRLRRKGLASFYGAGYRLTETGQQWLERMRQQEPAQGRLFSA